MGEVQMNAEGIITHKDNYESSMESSFPINRHYPKQHLYNLREQKSGSYINTSASPNMETNAATLQSNDGKDGLFIASSDSEGLLTSTDDNLSDTSIQIRSGKKQKKKSKAQLRPFFRGRRQAGVVQSGPKANTNHPASAEHGDRFCFADGYECPSQDHSDGSSCVVLRVCGLFFSSDLGAILCQSLSGGCLIPANKLVRHLRSHHSKSLKFGHFKLSVSKWTEIANHILVAHNLDAEQSSQSLLDILPASISTPLPVLTGIESQSTIALFYKCPYEDCREWALVSSPNSGGSKEYNIRRHYREAHKGELSWLQHYESTMVQKVKLLSSDTGSLLSVWFKLESLLLPSVNQSILPAAPSIYPDSGEPINERITSATWMHELGWATYLDSLGEDVSVDKLRALVALPSVALTNTPGITSNMQHIEMGLYMLYRDSIQYFQNVNGFLNARHSSVREAVTAKSTKSRFREVKIATIRTYRRPMVLTLAFMTRFLEAKADGSIQGLGSFDIEGYFSQVDAVAALREYFLEHKGKPNLDRMRILMHTAFESLLRPPYLKDSKIACPTDQVLFLMALRGPGQYIRANAVQYLCAGLQYSFRCTMVHVARLQSIGTTEYMPWASTSHLVGGPHQDAKAEEEDTTMDQRHCHYESDDDLDQPSDLEGADLDIPQELGMGNISETDAADTPSFNDQVMKYLNMQTSWVTTVSNGGAANTPYQHVKDVLYALAPWSRRFESNGSSFSVSPNGQILEFRDSHEEPLTVNMLSWMTTAADLCDRVFPEAIKAMIPEVCGCAIEEFDFDDIRDDLTKSATHQQPHNTDKLKPLCDLIIQTLLSPSNKDHNLVGVNGQILPKKLAVWLAHEQNVLGIIATIFVLTSGPCFRSFQFRTLQYDASPTLGSRNLYFFSNDCIGLAHPQAKQLDQQSAPTALSFPPSISQYLRLYFWIIRPIGIHLLHQAGITVPEYSSVIWVNPVPNSRRKSHKYEWTSYDIHLKLQQVAAQPLGFMVDCPLVRQIAHAIFRTKIPSLFDHSMSTAASVASMMETGPLRTFANKMRVPALANMDQVTFRSCLLVSEIWQATLGLRTLNPALEHIVQGSNIHPTSEFIDAAFNRARTAIQQFYGAAVSDTEQGAEIQVNRPFLLGIAHHSLTELHPIKLGDDALQEVTYAVLFGSGKPRLTATPPLGGLHVDDVALAASLLTYALDEQLDGHFKNPLPSSVDREYYYGQTFQDLQSSLHEFKSKHIKEWLEFSTDIYTRGYSMVYKDTANITNSVMDILGLSV